jgi:endonuclease YncB( thermonuclease family)
VTADPLGQSGCAALLLLGALLLAPPAACAAEAPAFEAGETVAARAVQAGGVVLLADGRSVALAGIGLPRRGQPLADKAEAELAKLVAGRAVELRYGGARRDRHGRVLAQLFADGRWVEGELLRRGLARVESTADNRLGVGEMLALEHQARDARRGIWRTRFFAVRPAADAGRDAGSFQIVEGSVVDAVLIDGTLYLNFARDWRHGFSVKLAADARRLFRDAGSDPRSLAGRRLLVRGYIQDGERPTIDVTHPEQLERLDPS